MNASGGPVGLCDYFQSSSSTCADDDAKGESLTPCLALAANGSITTNPKAKTGTAADVQTDKNACYVNRITHVCMYVYIYI